jgi:hypothetical protein
VGGPLLVDQIHQQAGRGASYWELLCPEASVSPTTEDTPLLETDTIWQIEEAIWDTVQTQYRIRWDEILYDATNCFTLFQTETAASVAQRGHNKAGRDAQRQVGLAVAATRDGGFPLLSWVYRGNGHDAKLFPESMTRLINRIARLQHDAHHLVLTLIGGTIRARILTPSWLTQRMTLPGGSMRLAVWWPHANGVRWIARYNGPTMPFRSIGPRIPGDRLPSAKRVWLNSKLNCVADVLDSRRE